MAFLLFIEITTPALFASSIIGYIVKINSNPKSIVDFAYPPLIYLTYKAITSFTTNPALIQLPTIAADLLSGFLLLKIGLRFLDRFRSLLATFAYLFNPILIWISTVYVFDSIAIFFMLLAIYLAVERRAVPAALSLAIGFNIKLFPLLLTPVFLGRLRKKSSTLNLSAFLIFPVAILLTTIPIIQMTMGLTLDQLLRFYISYYQHRESFGFSVWLVFRALVLGAGSGILLISYALQAASFLYVTLRTNYRSDLDYFSFSLFALYFIVNLSFQLYPYYLLWFYPFLLLIAFRGTDAKRLIVLFTLTGLTYALPSIYIYSHVGFNLSNLPVPALGGGRLDYFMFFSNQIATWSLFAALLRWRKDSRAQSPNGVGAQRVGAH